jgi:hypothetical protein
VRVAKNMILPPGYRTAWAGGFEDLQVAKERLEFTVPSLVGIPAGVIGGIWALWVTGSLSASPPLSASSRSSASPSS